MRETRKPARPRKRRHTRCYVLEFLRALALEAERERDEAERPTRKRGRQ